MIEEILPAATLVEEAREDPSDVRLFPEELAALGNAVEKRRREFATARLCARRALARLDLPLLPIPAGPRGEPRWPVGIVGSITHCEGYRGCALARSADLLALGIDAEPHRALPAGVLELIAGAEELAWLRQRALVAPRVSWDRLLFSAKESVYKAWFPLTGRSLDFTDVVIAVDPREGTFSAQLSAQPLASGPDARSSPNSGAGRTLHGRWLIRDGLLLTAITLSRLA